MNCPRCGETVDPTILANRSPGWRKFWKDKAERGARPLSREEKILLENEEEALRFGL
jgi:hypothetical protein